MGCDYYIEKYLYIFFNDKSSSYILLSREKGYFYYPDIDEDVEDYEKQFDECVAEQLKVQFSPMVIYSNNKFLSDKLEQKYKTLIESNNSKGWNDIVHITKKESRYERD